MDCYDSAVYAMSPLLHPKSRWRYDGLDRPSRESSSVPEEVKTVKTARLLVPEAEADLDNLYRIATQINSEQQFDPWLPQFYRSTVASWSTCN
jgi:hypothetical protein